MNREIFEATSGMSSLNRVGMSRRDVLKLAAVGTGVLLTPQLLSAASAYGQTAQYAVEIENQTHSIETFFVFQSDTSANTQEQFHIAQQSIRLNPDALGQLSWNMLYGFFWARAQHVSPGIVLSPAEILHGDPTQYNAAKLVYNSDTGNADLTDLHAAEPSGSFMLDVDSAVPAGQFAAGLTLNGQPVTAVPADPGEQLFFSQPSSFAIGVGPVEKGEAVNLQSLLSYAQLPFGENATKLRAVSSESAGSGGLNWDIEAVG